MVHITSSRTLMIRKIFLLMKISRCHNYSLFMLEAAVWWSTVKSRSSGFSCLEMSCFTGNNYYACALLWNKFFTANLVMAISSYLSNYCYYVCSYCTILIYTSLALGKFFSRLPSHFFS